MGELFVPNKQKIRGIDRLELEPRDFDATAKFWRQMGFQVTIRGEAGRREASLKANDLRLLFRETAEDPGMDRRRSPFTRLRIALGIRDFEAYLTELRGKGIAVPESGHGQGASRAVEVIDPNGIRLLLEEVVHL